MAIMKFKIFQNEEIGVLETDCYTTWMRNFEDKMFRCIGSPANLPYLHTRKWEYFVSLHDVVFGKQDLVLDTGSYNTFICAYVSDMVKSVFPTDSFGWAKRDYVVKNKLDSPERWMSRLSYIGNVFPLQIDLVALPFKSNCFDKIFCFSTIEHVPHDVKAMKELWRVLKSGGQLLLTTDVDDHDHKYFNYGRVYSPQSFRELILRSIDHDVGEFNIDPGRRSFPHKQDAGGETGFTFLMSRFVK